MLNAVLLLSLSLSLSLSLGFSFFFLSFSLCCLSLSLGRKAPKIQDHPYCRDDSYSDLFSTQISGRNFLPELCGGVHPQTAPLQALCCALCSTEQSTFRGGEKGEKVSRKGEEEGWPAKGAKRKKGRVKTGRYCRAMGEPSALRVMMPTANDQQLLAILSLSLYFARRGFPLFALSTLRGSKMPRRTEGQQNQRVSF